jgi:DNA polymerase-3 subunit epsilon
MLSNRASAVHSAQEKLAQRPIYLDTETSGTDRYSEIVEVCLVDDEGQLLYQSLVKPGTPIPIDAIRIHGITNEMVKNSPNWLRVWPEVEHILIGRQIGIYNAEFDLRMIQQTHAKYRIHSNQNSIAGSFCIMKLYAQFYGEWDAMRGSYRWQSLEAAGRQCQIQLINSHRAFDDCLLARQILHYIADSRAT